jgi:hypothetical protein
VTLWEIGSGYRHDSDDPPSSGALMPQPLDQRLRDDTVLDEIELTSRLMIAATELGRPLSQREVDEILGVVAS